MYQLFIPTINEAKALAGTDKTFKVRAFADVELDAVKILNTDIIITGCGKASASITASLFMAGSNKIPVLAGIAGAYTQSGLQIGDTGFVETEYFVDEALITAGSNGLKLQTIDEIGFPICDGNCISLKVPDSTKTFKSNTVSCLMGTEALSELYYNKTRADIENMEGAAFALAAARFGRQIIEVRAVSNYCGDRHNQKWNIKKACANLLETIKEYGFLT